LLGRHQQAVRTVGIRRPAVHAGIQSVELVRVDARELGRESHVDLTPRIDDREPTRVRDRRERDAVLERIRDELPDGEQPRNIGLRLGGQILADAPEVGGLMRGLGALERALHIAFPGVVACDREQPVAELLVHRLEIVEGRAGRFDHVAPPVVPPVLLEPESLTGARNELPEPAARPSE
jgi:hypothetical protein